jgi:hypothetical protein
MSASSWVLYRFTYISICGCTRLTITPSRCTSGGRSGITWFTRLLTFTTAWLGSVPGWKMTWMVASPALVASEIM